MAFQSCSSGCQLNKGILSSHMFPRTDFLPPVLSNRGAWHMIGSSKIAQETSKLTTFLLFLQYSTSPLLFCSTPNKPSCSQVGMATPQPVHVNSPWQQTQTPEWTLLDEDGGRSQLNFQHQVDDQQWSPADASSGPERGLRTRHIMRRHGIPYQKDTFSPTPSKHHLGPWNRCDSRQEVDRRFSVHNTPSSAACNTYLSSGAKPSISSAAETAPSHVSNSLMLSSSSMALWDVCDSRHLNDRQFSDRNNLLSSSACENNYASLGATCPSVPEITALQCSNPPITSPSSTALQPTMSACPARSGIDDARVSQQPKRITFAEYKACKQCQEKHAASNECEGSVGTTEGIPISPSSLSSVDIQVKIFLLAGPAPVVECSAAMAPEDDSFFLSSEHF